MNSKLRVLRAHLTNMEMQKNLLRCEGGKCRIHHWLNKIFRVFKNDVEGVYWGFEGFINLQTRSLKLNWNRAADLKFW